MLRSAPVSTSEAQTVGSVSAYRAAIDHTTQVIERRAWSFRNLVVAVVLIGLASLAWALGTRSLSGLVGCLFMIPACNLFLVADTKRLDDWRSALIERWTSRDLDFIAFLHAIRAYPGLPKSTVEAMLATLPSAGGIESEHRVSGTTRRALAADSHFIHRGRSDSLLLNVLASVVATGSVLAALSAGTWVPLLCLAIVTGRPVVGAWMRRRRRGFRDAQIDACRRQPGFDEAQYAELRASLR